MDSSACPLSDIAKLECLVRALREQCLWASQGIVKIDLTNSQAYMTADCKSDSW